MFNNCCGCIKKEEGVNKDGDAYGCKQRQDAKLRPGANATDHEIKSRVKLSNTQKIVPTLPKVTVTEPDNGPRKTSRDEGKAETGIQNSDNKGSEKLQNEVPASDTKGNETTDNTVTCSIEDRHDKMGCDVPDPKVIARSIELLLEEEERGRPSALPDEDDLDTDTLQTVERGMMRTQHPTKRGIGVVPHLVATPRWLSQEDDDIVGEGGGTAEPPATPVGRDELALRRHRFFSDFVQAHQAGTEHRVRFDPLGPTVAEDCETEPQPHTPAIELESLLNRLERVTTRLEQTVGVTSESLFRQPASQTSVPEPLPLPTPQPPPPPPSQLTEEATYKMSVAAFGNIIQGPLSQYLQFSAKIGGDVAIHSKLVEKAFRAQSEFLTIASRSAAPSSQSDIMKLLEPTSAQIMAVMDFFEKNRGSPYFNHLNAVTASIPALSWVTVPSTPSPYVKEMNDAGQFYTNRVLKDWKEQDKTHVDWVKSWIQTLTELQQFVKQYHTTGLVWGGQGAAAGPPPPPGLPPLPPLLPLDVSPPTDNSMDRSALFKEINKGEAVTSTLKHVTPDMQTHKNAALRTGPAPFKAPLVSNSHRHVSAFKPVDKPPTLYKDGKKWIVEHHQGNHSLVIEDNVQMNNVVYMFNCHDSTLTVKGKLNSVFLDSCRKSSVVFDSLVSSVEFVNCQSVQMQVLGKVPTISIDKTDGCQMYLSPESLDVAIISSKSSEMNVLFPEGNGDYVEFPVPEQFKTTVHPTGLVTVAVESKG